MSAMGGFTGKSGENPKMTMPQNDDKKSEKAPITSDGKIPTFNKTPQDKPDAENKKNNTDEKAQERMKNMLSSIDVPDGYKAIFVSTGLSSETFIEIKAGLSEGDKVLLPDTTLNTNPMQGMMGMMGGARMGGMPMGGSTSMGRPRQTSTQNRAGGMR